MSSEAETIITEEKSSEKSCPYHKPSTWAGCVSKWYRGLPSPGAYEQLHKEVRGVFATNFLFDGAKVDFGKGLSPHVQVTQSIALGSQAVPPSYNLGAFYADKSTFVHGTVDHEGTMSARANYGITQHLTGKSQIQRGTEAGQLMVQLELDYSGRPFSVNAKAVNPSPAHGTGIFVANYLQSITKSIALGAELAYQHPNPEVKETQLSGVARVQLSQGGTWTTSVSPQLGVVQTSYHHKLNDQVELAAELQALVSQGRREGVCTIGGKWEFRHSTFRGQFDTSGRVGAVLEERLAPGFAVLFSGDIDHQKGASKFGIGLAVEM